MVEGRSGMPGAVAAMPNAMDAWHGALQMAVHEATSPLAADNEHLRLTLAAAQDSSSRSAEEAARMR